MKKVPDPRHPPMSFRPGPKTREQIAELSRVWGENQSRTISRAIAEAALRLEIQKEKQEKK